MERGVAILEAAVGLMTVVLLLTLSLRLVDVAEYSGVAEEITDRALLETSLKPLSVALAQDGTPQIEVNHQRVVAFITSVADRAQAALDAKLLDLGSSSAPYLIEVRYGVIGLNPSTGGYTGALELPPQGREVRGTLALGTALEHGTSLPVRFQKLAATALNDSQNLLAVPSSGYGSSDGEIQKYIERSVVVGIRVVVAPHWNVPVAAGGDSNSSAVKVVVLRGGVGDAQ